jgi:hypothetical protein
MQPLAAFLIKEHIDDLLREAEADRLAGAATRSRRVQVAWRRLTGAAARRLSAALEALALRLDPAVHRPSYGRE